VYKLSVDMWATSNVFKKGHVLRLEVSSSNFPRFDRNLNTGATRYLMTSGTASGAQYVSATNVVLHDAEHPSALILPVVTAK
jgi:predicted acyl esterase